MTEIHPNLKAQLTSNEHVLWVGQPRQGILIRRADAFLIPFSLFWTSFVVYWEFLAITSDAPLIFMLFGIPFLLIGIYLIMGRFIVEAKQRACTSYAVTSTRILIASGSQGRKIKSFDLRRVSELSMSEESHGEGSISFGRTVPFIDMFVSFAGLPGMDLYLGTRFERIANVKAVFDLIQNARSTIKD